MGLWAWLNLEVRDVFAYAICGALGFGAGLMVPDPSWGSAVAILVSYHLFLIWLVISGDDEAGMSQGLFVTIFTHLACVFLMVAMARTLRYMPMFRIARYSVAALALFERKWLFAISRYAPKLEGEIDLMKPRSERIAAPTGMVSAAPQYPSSYSGQTAASVAQPMAAPVRTAPAGIPQSAMLGVAAMRTAPPQQPAKYVPPASAQAAAPAAPPAAGPLQVPAAGAVQLKPVSDGKKGVLYQDTSISDGLRAKPAAAGAKVAPILSATAQDHEDWLRERAKSNPTHRKPGMSVKEEYEEWLKARFKARAAKNATAQ